MTNSQMLKRGQWEEKWAWALFLVKKKWGGWDGRFLAYFFSVGENGAMYWFELRFMVICMVVDLTGYLFVISSVYKHQYLISLPSSASLISNNWLLVSFIYKPLHCIQHFNRNVKNFTCSLFLASLALQLTQSFDYRLALSWSPQTQLNFH